MKFPVRLLFATALFLVSIFVFKPIAFAQTSAIPQQNFVQPSASTNVDSNVPNNLHNWTQTVLIEVISATSCLVTGMDPTNPNQQCLGIDQKTNKIGFVQNGRGAIGMLTSSLAIIYTPPLHTGDYLSYLSKNFGLAKSSYAATGPGIGFNSLSPVMNIWVAFRNITYAFFVIIFLIIGIAIMLRVRIDPRTVMTIQNQIPKIIIGIVLVTFSFAIAGFLIDMMWTSMYVLYGTLNSVPVTGVAAGAALNGFDPISMQANTPMGIANNFTASVNPNDPFQYGIFGIANHIAIPMQDFLRSSLGVKVCQSILGCGPSFPSLDMSNLANSFGGLLQGVATSPVSFIIDIASFIVGLQTFLKIAPLGAGAAEGLGLAASIPLGAAAGLAVDSITDYLLRDFAPWLIIFVVIYLAIFISLIRLWFELIKAYLFIIFDVIFAPFWIMAGLIPGNTAVNFSSWFKDLAANLAAFPAVAVMFMLGSLLMNGFTHSTASENFVPPLIGNPGDVNFLASLIGLAILLSTPTVVSLVKKAIKAPNLGIGAVGQGISAGTSMLKSGVGGVAAYWMKTPNMGQRGGLTGAVRKTFGV